MLHIDDPVYSDVSLHNKNSLDSDRPVLATIEPIAQVGGHLLSANEANVITCILHNFIYFHINFFALIELTFSIVVVCIFCFCFQICSTLNLPPTTYITMKTVMLSGCDQMHRQLSSPIEQKIRNYLTKSGWISSVQILDKYY